MHYGINWWVHFREKSTLATTSLKERGVGIFSRVGLFSGDYGTSKEGGKDSYGTGSQTPGSAGSKEKEEVTQPNAMQSLQNR